LKKDGGPGVRRNTEFQNGRGEVQKAKGGNGLTIAGKSHEVQGGLPTKIGEMGRTLGGDKKD